MITFDIPQSNSYENACNEFAKDILTCDNFKENGCMLRIHGLGKRLMEDSVSYRIVYEDTNTETEPKPIDIDVYDDVIREFKRRGYTISVLSKNYFYLTILIK